MSYLKRLQKNLLGGMRSISGMLTPSRISAPSRFMSASAFSKSWLRHRREVGARCRFDELKGHGLGAAYDHLAVVYDELEEVQRAYAVLLYNYIDHHASRVDDIRHALESSRKTFEQQGASRGAQKADAG